MPEPLELGLGVLDRQSPVKAAFGGKADNAACEGTDGGQACLADLRERPAEPAEQALRPTVGHLVDGVAQVAFDLPAETSPGGLHLHVYGAHVLCHRVLRS